MGRWWGLFDDDARWFAVWSVYEHLLDCPLQRGFGNPKLLYGGPGGRDGGAKVRAEQTSVIEMTSAVLG